VFTIRGRVNNARNGRWLSGVKVTVEGTSNSVTSSMGFFTIRNVPAGAVNLVYEMDDFITNTRPLTITGNVNSGGVADISMSPAMNPDQWRAVVKWGSSPRDLDTYGKFGTGKVWYGKMRHSGGNMQGTLEVDRTSGYGPETLYLSGVGTCRGGSRACDIKYQINDYSRTGSMLSRAEAEVTLYNGDHVAGSYKISDCPSSVSRDGNWWTVFTIDGQTNTVKWGCQSGALIQTDSTNRTMATSSNLHHQDALAIQKPGLRVRRIPK